MIRLLQIVVFEIEYSCVYIIQQKVIDFYFFGMSCYNSLFLEFCFYIDCFCQKP